MSGQVPPWDNLDNTSLKAGGVEAAFERWTVGRRTRKGKQEELKLHLNDCWSCLYQLYNGRLKVISLEALHSREVQTPSGRLQTPGGVLIRQLQEWQEICFTLQWRDAIMTNTSYWPGESNPPGVAVKQSGLRLPVRWSCFAWLDARIHGYLY